jgi:hypothetical protein
MARFSQTFLQGLLQPSYQQGLFEAARGLGQTPGVIALNKKKKEDAEQLKSLMIGPPTVERIAQIRSMAASMAVTNPTRAKGLITAADSMQKQYDALQKQEDQMLTGLAQNIASAPSITNITDYVGSSAIPDYKKPAVIKQATELRKIIVSAQQNEDERVLSPDELDFIKRNKKVFDNDPMFKKHMAVLEQKEGDFGVGEKLLAARGVRAILQTEIERQTKAQFSSAAVKAQATGYIRAFMEQDSISEFYFGRDAVQTARKVFNDEDLKDDFVEFVGAEYEKNPNIDASVAVKNALDFMGEKYDEKLEFGRLLNVEEARQTKADREEAIQYLMEKEDLSRKDAIRELNARRAKKAIEKKQEEVTQPVLPQQRPQAVSDAQAAFLGRTSMAPAVTPAPVASGGIAPVMTPSQMRSGAIQTLTDINKQAAINKEAARRRAQAGMLSGGRPIRN